MKSPSSPLVFAVTYSFASVNAENLRHRALLSLADVETPFIKQLAQHQQKYWMVRIPSNINGEVDCNIKGGVVGNPFVWETEEGDFDLPQVECAGLGTSMCCTKFLDAVRNEGIPLTDRDGACLSCFVSLDPLTEVIWFGGDDDLDGTIKYHDHEWNIDTKTCQEVKMTRQDLDIKDKTLQIMWENRNTLLEEFIESSETRCKSLKSLHEDFLFLGRGFPNAMPIISTLLCGICEDEQDGENTIEISDKLVLDLRRIQKYMSGAPRFAEASIIMFSDNEGNLTV